MAISITSQPTEDGVYSAYFPIEIIATETTNPEYLYFQVRNADNTEIEGVPYYKAYNINNTFTFNAASIIKSLFNVRTTQGTSTTAIEELTDIYGKYNILINKDTNTTGATYSDAFFSFAMIDNTRHLNDQTANYAVNGKGLHYSSKSKTIGVLNVLASKKQGTYDRVVLFVQETYLYVDTYLEKVANINNTIIENLRLDTSSYIGKLISVPLNEAFIGSNFLNVLAAPGNFNAFRVRNHITNNVLYHNIIPECNELEFVFINRYGNKENIQFTSTNNVSLETKGEEYKTADATHTGNTTYFNTESNTQKINQETLITHIVKGNKKKANELEVLEDFFSSPVCWFVSSELIPIVVSDGSYNLVDDSRGLEINFKYSFSQRKLSFK